MYVIPVICNSIQIQWTNRTTRMWTQGSAEDNKWNFPKWILWYFLTYCNCNHILPHMNRKLPFNVLTLLIPPQILIFNIYQIWKHHLICYIWIQTLRLPFTQYLSLCSPDIAWCFYLSYNILYSYISKL